MRYGLGIDAGGTYTDAVIIDFSSQRILAKSKALTTKYDLSVGIAKALDSLQRDQLKRVSLVSLSTTLATNAIVEGMGNLVGAVLMGFDKYDLAKIAHKPVRSIRGRTDIEGKEIEPLDEGALRNAVRELEDNESVAAYAVSGMVAVKNPAQEIRAKAIIAEITDKPVVCGHEISMQLDTIKRTNTAILNARLLPIISELIDHVKKVIVAHGVHSPLMIVRGDGTLMTETTARRHPVETILSGPAASVCGALFLTSVSDGLVIDIGGTTSDIALIIDGKPAVATSGVSVGAWSTNVRAVDIDTLGLAGDSAVSVSRTHHLSLGPRRALPLAVLGSDSPSVLDELDRLWDLREKRTSLIQPVEFFVKVKEGGAVPLSETEAKTLSVLSEGPLSRDRLGDRLGVVDPSMVPTARMETLGLIQRSTLTPTDILHIRGSFLRWNAEASRRGLRFYSYVLGLDEERVAELILETFTQKTVLHLMRRILRHPRGGHDHYDDRLIDLILSGKDKLGFSTRLSYAYPLIGIGAPAYALAPAVAQRFGAELTIPEHAEVANAVGAITGLRTVSVEVVVLPSGPGFLVHSPVERREFSQRVSAQTWAKAHAMELLEARIRDEDHDDTDLQREINVQDTVTDTEFGEVFLESTIRAVAVHKSSLISSSTGT
ncbi:MAG: hydantoinase/oxoprolinase family protein [Treponemataceae bacterium]